MAELDQIRQKMRASRTARDQASDALAVAQERLKSIDAQIADLNRVLSPNNAQQSAQLAQLQQNRTKAEADLKQLSDAQAAALANEATLIQSFAAFSDPRQGIQQLNDSTPI